MLQTRFLFKFQIDIKNFKAAVAHQYLVTPEYLIEFEIKYSINKLIKEILTCDLDLTKHIKETNDLPSAM